MNQLITTLLFLLCWTSFSQAAVLSIDIENIDKDHIDSPIAFAVFANKKGFPRKKKFVKKTELPLKIKLTKSNYAIAIFHDQNKNQKLDTNFIGIPKEPFGFSNNPKLLTGPPSFKRASVIIPHKDSTINIKIKLRDFL